MIEVQRGVAVPRRAMRARDTVRIETLQRARSGHFAIRRGDEATD
jgi:hypothetical protein